MVEMDKYKIRGVQDRVAQVLSTKEFTPAEVVFGLAEFIGRMIVGYTPNETWIAKKELCDAAARHMELTVKVGIEKQQAPN